MIGLEKERMLWMENERTGRSSTTVDSEESRHDLLMSINFHLPELNLVQPLASPILDVVNATIHEYS